MPVRRRTRIHLNEKELQRTSACDSDRGRRHKLITADWGYHSSQVLRLVSEEEGVFANTLSIRRKAASNDMLQSLSTAASIIARMHVTASAEESAGSGRLERHSRMDAGGVAKRITLRTALPRTRPLLIVQHMMFPRWRNWVLREQPDTRRDPPHRYLVTIRRLACGTQPVR